MKTFRNIIFISLLLPLVALAQDNKNLFKYEIGKLNRDLNGNLYVKQGEFKIDFDNKVIDAAYGKVYRYFIIVRNDFGDITSVRMNNYYINFSDTENHVEILKAGYTIPDYIYVEKRNALAFETGKYKYTLNVKEKSYGPYDGIVEVLPNGFVYKNKDVFTYSRYDKDFISNKSYCILEKDNYTGEYIQCVLNDKLLKFVPKEKVDYYKSYDGHYYIHYKDNYMKNSLLVVDGEGFELDGAEKSVLLRFSHNGEHWIAAGKNYVLVDGVIVEKTKKIVKKVIINDNGDYMYVTESEGDNEKIYHGDNVLVDGIRIVKLTVDDDENFYYVFKNSKGYFFGINNDIQNMEDDLKVNYYPEIFDGNQTFTVESKDGKHTFVYSYDTPYITIDGVKIDCPTIPHYAIWDESEKSFVWNAVEDVKLMVYKYKVKK